MGSYTMDAKAARDRPRESTPNHQGTLWHDPIRAGAIDAFNRLLDTRERCDVPGTIRAIRDLKKCGFRVGLLRPAEGGGY